MSDTFDRARLITFFVAVAACTVFTATPAQAQSSCSAMITPMVVSPPPFLVGDVFRVNLLFGPETIQNGTNMTIPEMLYKLDCFDGGLFDFCLDEGMIVGIPEAGLSIGGDCGDFGITWEAALADGDPNQIVFDAVPDLVLAAFQQCNLSFDLEILNRSEDLTPNLIQQAAKFTGDCDNSLMGQARGTLGVSLADCNVEVDKQVSCDGGTTWQDEGFEDEDNTVTDGCSTVDGNPVLVRYFANNAGNLDLVCELVDSNGLVLGDLVSVGPLDQFFLDQIAITDPPLTCNDDLDANEPDKATLSCTCTFGETELVTMDTDEAEIECLTPTPGLVVQKECSDCDPATGKNAVSILVTNPDNPQGASLTNCVATDPLAGFTSDPFDLAPGESMQFDQEVGPLDDMGAQDNQASVTCDIVGAGGETISRSAEATCIPCECDVKIDKQVSCDGGATYVDVGFGDGVAETCTGWDTPGDPEVKVRYVADADVHNQSGVLGEAVNCELTDSNGAILPVPLNIGTLAGDFSGVIHMTDLLECSEGLELGEPNTATLSCECYEPGSGIVRTDEDQADIECQEPGLELQKDCSECDPATGKNTVDIRVTNPDNPRGASLTNCVASDPTLGFTSAPFDLAPGESKHFDQEVGPLDDVGAQDNQASVTCDIVGAGGETISRSAEATCIPCECDVKIDKQVSCDGGATYVDVGFGDGVAETCTGWDTPGDPEVKVRYVADADVHNQSGVLGEAVNCELTDSNGAILPVPLNIGTLAGDFSGVIHMTDLLECSEGLELGEPNTATLSCECYEPGSGIVRTDEDQADIECQEPGLELQKDCSECDPATGKNTVDIRVTNPDNPRGASLTNCVASDPTLGFTSAPFDLAPGESKHFDQEVGPLDDVGAQDNQASVTCDIVGAGGETISRSAEATCIPCECDVKIDKQVSCDGGATYVDVGFGDGVAETCTGWDTPGDPEVKVRYVADADVHNQSGVLGEAVNCELTDSNGAILPVPLNIGTLAGDFSGVIHMTDLLECSEGLELGEPNTATLSCECYEDGSGIFRDDEDQADIECQEPGLELQKDCSECDPATGKNTVDIRVTNPDNPRGASLTNCVASDPTLGFTSAPFDLAPGESKHFDQEVGPLDDVGAQDNQASVTCDIVGAGGETISRSAEATCIPCECDVKIDKQVSCDGGATYVDVGFGDGVAETCTGWDTPGDPEVKVRYVADADVHNQSGVLGEAVNCELTDSNGAILPVPLNIGTLAGDFSGVIHMTDLLECSEGLELGEPNTATLSCECYKDGSGIFRDDEDQADIECQEPGLELQKDCSECDPATGKNTVDIRVTNPDNPRGASLTNCVASDPTLGFTSDPFDLAPGESMHFDQEVGPLDDVGAQDNQASVTCDIVGAGGETISRSAEATCLPCECEVEIDKQVSCDGGITWSDSCVGWDTPGDPEVKVRYVTDSLAWNPRTEELGQVVNCVLTDSNGAILPAPVPINPGDPYETGLLECNANLELGEPDTAILRCECYEPGSGIVRTDEDQADIECQEPGLELQKECSDCDPATGKNTVDIWVTNPDNPRGASLANCVASDPTLGFTSDPFDLALGESMHFDQEVGPLDEETLNEVSVTCDIVGADKTISRTAEATCFPCEVLCDLKVIKTCIVQDVSDGDDDDDDDDCDGRVVSMKLQYTGDGCEATTNEQSGQVSCYGDAGGGEPVSILVTDRRGNEVYADESGVFLGDIVDASAENADQQTGGAARIGPNTLVTIDDGAESVMFHTSCSQPLAVGDQFGSMLVVEMTTTNGGTVTLPATGPVMDNPDAETSECVISATPPGPHCDGKVQALGLRYVGGNCDQSNDQGDRADCSGNAGASEPVRIRCFKDSGTVYLDTMDAIVGIGDVVNASAANAGDTEFGSETLCEIYDDSWSWLQDLRFHTSCSRPLNLGDRFGALEVFSLDTSSGGNVSQATEVLYRYRITNDSAVAAHDVTAYDSELGEVPRSPIATIAPDETMLLEASALISETTTNTVTVTAVLETGEECDAVEDTATVTVEDPPVLQECTSKIDAMLLQYIGPDIAGPVTVEALPRTQSQPVVYQFPGGLANGTIVSSPEQNGFTVDPGAQGEDDAGSKTSIFINGDEEVHHTSCSTPYVSGLPAPLDNPKGDPSPNWFVINFTQK